MRGMKRRGYEESFNMEGEEGLEGLEGRGNGMERWRKRGGGGIYL